MINWFANKHIFVLTLVLCIGFQGFANHTAAPRHFHTTIDTLIQDTLFSEFIKQFPTKSLPYAVKFEDLNGAINPSSSTNLDDLRIDEKYMDYVPDMLNAQRVKREMPIFSYVARLFESDKFVLVVYRIDKNGLLGAHEYVLASYQVGNDGIKAQQRLINSITIGAYGLETVTAELASDMELLVEYWTLDGNSKEAPTENQLTMSVEYIITKIGVVKEINKHNAKKKKDNNLTPKQPNEPKKPVQPAPNNDPKKSKDNKVEKANKKAEKPSKEPTDNQPPKPNKEPKKAEDNKKTSDEPSNEPSEDPKEDN